MILPRLKERTRDAHRSIEAAVELMSPGLTRAAYVRYLARLWGFYRPLEPLLAPPLEGSAVDFPRRRKLALLERDLATFGAPSRDLPTCAALPEVGSRAAALGCLYVLEGSTLGGQLIKRHVCQVLPLTPPEGLAFLDAYGDQLGPMWKAFGAAISAECSDEPSASAAERGATETFRSLEAWLRA